MITRNRRQDLMRSLERLVALPERPAVVVVDNASDDGTVPAVRHRFPGVMVVPLAANVGAEARTTGARLAGTRYVAFADDDSWWLPGSLEAAAAVMDSDPAVALVAGRILVGAAGRTDPTSAAMAAGPLGPGLRPDPDGRRAVTGCVACASVVRTGAFLSVGGFPEGFMVGGEEQTVVWDLWAAGWRAVYVPEATAVHFPAESRDPRARRALVTRNDLWAAWSRLPAVPAAARTARLAGRALTDRSVALGTGRALRGAAWALARRAPIPVQVERARRVLAGGWA